MVSYEHEFWFFMKAHCLNRCLKTVVFLSCLLSQHMSYSAIGQFLDDIFFQNPAELSDVHQSQWMAGNIYIVPEYDFTGTAKSGDTGTAFSKVNNSLPYILTAYRVSDKWVLGLNITPSDYGHVEWPFDSVPATNSSIVNVIYYRAGMQTSYQFTPDLSIGLGLNLEYNKIQELDFVVPGFGNEINKVTGLNYSADFGLSYRVRPRSTFIATVYTPVNTFASGTSSLGNRKVDTLSSNVLQAAVAYVGLLNQITDKWRLDGKIYWSGWSIQKDTILMNTITGTYIVPTDWKDVWSYQVVTRYDLTDRLAILGSAIYETNPVSAANNQVGYPLSSSLSASSGLDFNLHNGFSVQLVYGYSALLPQAVLSTSYIQGTVTSTSQLGVVQITYKS